MQGAVAASLEPREAPPTLPQPSTSSASPPHSGPSNANLPSPTLSKHDRVTQAAREQDVHALREIANGQGGFETSELRRIAWPVLLRCDLKGKGKADPVDELANLPARDDERQVRLDIVRSLINYPQHVNDENREALRTRLETVILTVLRRHPALQYFQGYHDIVSVLLLTLDDDELVVATAEQLSLHRIRDSMGAGLEPTLGYLKLVHRLVRQVDPELHSVVNQAASMPFFALSWALTLLAHDLESVAVMARLFDFILANNPSMIIYLVVAILVTKRDDVIAVASAVGDDDPAIIHSALSQLPNIVLSLPSDAPSYPSPPRTPTSPSPSRSQSLGKYASSAAGETDYADEDLMSSGSIAGSSSTSNLTDLTFSPSIAASSRRSSTSAADFELSESLISHSEASSSGLRNRHHRPSMSLSLSDSFASGVSEWDGDDDNSVHALDDSMLSDPDCDVGLSSFSSFASLPDNSTSSRSRTPSPPRAQILREEALASPSALPPPRAITADSLISLALSLSISHPLVEPPTSSTSASASQEDSSAALSQETTPSTSLSADEILGPNSCVFTFSASESGELTDADAEAIVERAEGIFLPAALTPDALPSGEADDDDDEEGDYEVVDAPASSRRRRASRGRGGAGLPGRLNLGPHGWLVLGGAAVATAAVAYGVYRQGHPTSVLPRGVSGPQAGLGTAGVGLGRGALGGGLGGMGGVPGGAAQVVLAPGAGLLGPGMGGIAARMAEGMEGRVV